MGGNLKFKKSYPNCDWSLAEAPMAAIAMLAPVFEGRVSMTARCWPLCTCDGAKARASANAGSDQGAREKEVAIGIPDRVYDVLPSSGYVVIAAMATAIEGQQGKRGVGLPGPSRLPATRNVPGKVPASPNACWLWMQGGGE